MERWIPRSLDALDELFRTVDESLLPLDLPERVGYAVRLAAEELFTNLVRHNRGGRSHILFSIEAGNGRLSLTLRDFDVEPFDAATIRPVDPQQPLSERTPGGLGVHMVRMLFDELSYRYEDKALVVTAVKRLEEADVRDHHAGER